MRLLPAALSIAVTLVAACGGDDEPPENQPPIAVDDVASGDEDTVITIDVLANDSDPDGDRLRIVNPLADGHLVREVDGRLALTPAPDFHGEIAVTYRLSDGLARADGRATVTVRPVNDAPRATEDLVATGRNTATAVVLTGTDIDGDALTFEVVGNPASGTITGTAPALTYTPNHNFVGTDTLTFRARDASAVSEPAAIAIDVVAGARPVAEGQTLWTLEDNAKAITLVATDADGDALTYTITQQPQHGTLSGTAPNLTYTPAADYSGSDTFRWTASDGVLTSPVATIHIEITADNDPPVASDQSVTTSEDVPRGIVLHAHDPENTQLTYTIVAAPAHGTLTGTGGMRTYTPAANFHGVDTFTYTVSDGFLTSAVATVSVGVDSIPDVPVAVAQTVAATEDTTRTITLTGTDGDGDDLSYVLLTAPSHGTLLGSGAELTYMPHGHYNGPDSFTFRVGDLDHVSQPATVTINVAAVDDAPVLVGTTFSGDEDAAIAIPLPSMDVDGELLTYAVVTPPVHGTIAGSGAARTYRAVNYDGPDTFALTATDGHTTTAPATFTVNVTPMPDAPIARDDIGIATPGQTLELDVLANDDELDGEVFFIQSVSTPTAGTAETDTEVVHYTPAAGNTAPVTFTYTIVDSAGLTATAKVTVGIGAFPSGVGLQVVGKVISSTALPLANGQLDVSRDGRYVAFATSDPLEAGDTNQAIDVYLWDRVADTREWISRRPDGGVANGTSFQPSISGDGRYIAFSSIATNLVAGDTNGANDIFVHDRETGATVRASVSSSGAQATGNSGVPSLSDDGTVVAFSSSAFDLIALDTNGVSDIFVRDLSAGTTARVSARSGGGEADRSSSAPVLSGDGKVVAFVSTATNLVNGDGNNVSDVFVHDRTTGITERASVSSVGVEASAASVTPALSHDGRFVAFRSQATNLVPQGSAGTYVRDRQSPSTIAVGAFGNSVTMSADSRYVIGHLSDGTCFVRDRFTSTTQNLPSKLWFPVISANGRYITGASDQALVPGVPVGTIGYVFPNPL
jgi:Tol biopolymer transport system component